MPGAYIELCMHLAEEWPIFGLFLLLGNNGTRTIVCLAGNSDPTQPRSGRSTSHRWEPAIASGNSSWGTQCQPQGVKQGRTGSEVLQVLGSSRIRRPGGPPPTAAGRPALISLRAPLISSFRWPMLDAVTTGRRPRFIGALWFGATMRTSFLSAKAGTYVHVSMSS